MSQVLGLLKSPTSEKGIPNRLANTFKVLGGIFSGFFPNFLQEHSVSI